MLSDFCVGPLHPADLNAKLDRGSIFKELLPIADQWKSIGYSLGLDIDDLNKIRRSEPTRSDRLQALIAEWLKQSDPPPTWSALADAMGDIDVMKAQKLQQRIAYYCS